uniref:RNA helicase n=1 Tax=Myripristis murdjan TaxID=586833 RepID=A0A667YIE0_9TELE
MSLKSNAQVGLDFFEFLKETNRASITDKSQLKDIYNSEFRNRTAELKDPNFSRLLYALKVSHKVTVYRGNVRFQVKAMYQDQWLTRRGQQPNPDQQNGFAPGPAQDLIPPDGAEAGVRARRKLASRLMTRLKVEKAQFISDKNGISITSDCEFENGKVCLCVENVEEHMVYLNVKNTGTKMVYFTHYTALHWLKYFTLKDEEKVTPANPLALPPGATYQILVHFRSSLVGFYPATLAFEFKPDLSASNAFYIVRFIEARCVTSLGMELAPTSPYRPQRISAQPPEPFCTIVDGQPPEGYYKTPQTLWNRSSLTCGSFSVVILCKKILLESPLSMENYSEKFQLLLYLEELQMDVDIKRYNIPNSEKDYASMFKDHVNKKLLVLELPGVSENRPSVLRGDKLLVKPKGEEGVKYLGYVHAVQLDLVKLGFSSKLLDRFVEGMQFSVEFTVNRLVMRIQHRAAELASTLRLGEVLFPDRATLSYQSLFPHFPVFSLFDRKLERNPEQYKAVQHIVAGSSKPAPYLVFGPPGTGKTVTLVEAIKQIEKTQASCHILACAPSNSAADLLCKKILEHVEERKVFRMYASSREPKFVPDELKVSACSNLEGEIYKYPAKEELMNYKIMVTTLLTAGRLVTGNIPAGHFTHIFVDEAGHAIETECLVPLAGLLQAESGQVVLAGDPKQLGPILRSPFALQYGMGVSMLERLMSNFSLYQKEEEVFDNRFVTKLLQNYRSHPAILKIPNELFYDGELQVCADEIIRNSYCRWEYLPKRDFPVIFHGVTGLDEREKTSPSFFNVAEVEVLMDYLKKLLQTQGKKGLATISPSDIGIIAPYRKQVQKIRQALNKMEKDLKMKNLKYLKVGSVEEFQGQERRVIMVSTVRSSQHYTDFDQHFKLGFVKNEKRFNVAVTRAKALLIVVGNPVVLAADDVWARFIQYCKDEGGYTGFSHTEEEELVVARLASMFISIEAQVETEESVIQQHLDPEWRNDL